jgi:hypothetical protein
MVRRRPLNLSIGLASAGPGIRAVGRPVGAVTPVVVDLGPVSTGEVG